MFILGAVFIWVSTYCLVVADFDGDLKQLSDEYAGAGNPSTNMFLIVNIIMLRLYYVSQIIISDKIF